VCPYVFITQQRLLRLERAIFASVYFCECVRMQGSLAAIMRLYACVRTCTHLRVITTIHVQKCKRMRVCAQRSQTDAVGAGGERAEAEGAEGDTSYIRSDPCRHGAHTVRGASTSYKNPSY